MIAFAISLSGPVPSVNSFGQKRQAASVFDWIVATITATAGGLYRWRW